MYDKDKRRKRRHNTRRCKRRLKKCITMDMGLCVNSMKRVEVVQLSDHIIASGIEAKCLHIAKNLQIEE